MWLLSMDELLASTHAHLRPAALKYLAALDPYSHKLCIFAQEICESMSSTCKFLKACRVKVSNGLLGLYIVMLTLFEMHYSFLAKMELQVVLNNIHCVKLLFLFFSFLGTWKLSERTLKPCSKICTKCDISQAHGIHLQGSEDL